MPPRRRALAALGLTAFGLPGRLAVPAPVGAQAPTRWR
jgi:hypothetical protein